MRGRARRVLHSPVEDRLTNLDRDTWGFVMLCLARAHDCKSFACVCLDFKAIALERAPQWNDNWFLNCVTSASTVIAKAATRPALAQRWMLFDPHRASTLLSFKTLRQLDAPKEILWLRLRHTPSEGLQLPLSPSESDMALWWDRLLGIAQQKQSGSIVRVCCNVDLQPSMGQSEDDGLVDVLLSGPQGVWCVGTVMQPATDSNGRTAPFELGAAVLSVVANVAWPRSMWRPIIAATFRA